MRVTQTLRWTLLLCSFAALTAQTPPPLPPTRATPLPPASAEPTPTPGPPLRHLEYAFRVQTVGANGHTVTSKAQSGTMYVDVLSVASDGALVMRISEQAHGDARPGEAATCSVYGNTSVLCPPTPSPSETQWALLSYLGREFVDAAPWNAQGQWDREEHSDLFKTTEDFTLVDANAQRAIVHEVKKMQLQSGAFDNQNSDVVITYDRTMELPTLIHDDVVTTGGDQPNHVEYDFTLKRDSMKGARPRPTATP